MLETTGQSEPQEDSCSTLASAFSVWLARKTKENDLRKALLLGVSESVHASIEEDSNGLHRSMILVVDDESHIAITLSEILERRGYGTVWFTEPVAALTLIQVQRRDVLLTDVKRPMLGGFDLALCLKRTHPDCRVLITSALGNDPELGERIAVAGVSVVLEAKPVQICRFLSSVAELILAGTYAASAESFGLRAPR